MFTPLRLRHKFNANPHQQQLTRRDLPLIKFPNFPNQPLSSSSVNLTRQRLAPSYWDDRDGCSPGPLNVLVMLMGWEPEERVSKRVPIRYLFAARDVTICDFPNWSPAEAINASKCFLRPDYPAKFLEGSANVCCPCVNPTFSPWKRCSYWRIRVVLASNVSIFSVYISRFLCKWPKCKFYLCSELRLR